MAINNVNAANFAVLRSGTSGTSGTMDFSGSVVKGAGLDLITPTSIANSGGSASLSGGAVTFTGVSSVSLNGCFTSTYDNYRMIIQLTGSSTTLALNMRTRLSGSDDSTSSYYSSIYYIGTTGAAAGSTVGGVASSWNLVVGTDSTDTNSWMFMDLANPLSGKRKTGNGLANEQNAGGVGYGMSRFLNKIVSTNYDGFTLLTSTGTVSGTVRVYGYRN
jgi:hypothetical protein